MRSSVVSSQFDVHARFGGVVPELASRSHIEAILPVIDQALRDAGVALDDLDGIAVTRGPGLVGSLLVGLQAAKGLALARGLPFVGVHHQEGHLHAIFLDTQELEYPFLALVASGGHTSSIYVHDFGEYRMLGKTRDDAAGEAFDKVAKLLGLPYPGGREVEAMSRKGSPEAISFPRPMMQKGELDFSFSGLKTAVLVHVKKHGVPEGAALADLCASFQEAVAMVLSAKAVAAAKLVDCTRIVLAGGVAANERVRSALSEQAAAENLTLFLPPKPLCTDNAAMIAYAGERRLALGERSGWNLNARASLPLGGLGAGRISKF